MKSYSFFLMLTLVFVACNSTNYSIESITTENAYTNTIWDQLLKKHVGEDGKVNYQGFKDDDSTLTKYLSILSDNPPKEDWTKDKEMAYWINAYNAFTVKLIVDHYPVESIKDIKSGIPTINSVWDMKFFKIGGEDFDLNKIEHGILRKKWDEPRIHFGVNCASISCPDLINKSFTEKNLNELLDQLATSFINDPSKNMISNENIEVSKIFQWFKGDFTKNGSLIDYLNKYSEIEISEEAKVNYMDYDWSLNN